MNPFDLGGKVAVVTGANTGIGQAIAIALAAAGADITCVGRSAADETIEQVKALGRRAQQVKADLSTIAPVQSVVDETLARMGRLDILVNNAGAAWGADFDEFPESGWDKVMNLNVKSLFFLTKALAKPLRAAASAERPAKVINIASIDGIFVNPGETYSYAASKAAVIHLTRRMATKLIKEHINVTAIAPGAFASDMNRAARDEGNTLAKLIPAQRIGTDEDMAGIAIYLASRAGDYVVGNTIAVDGGVVYANAGLPVAG